MPLKTVFCPESKGEGSETGSGVRVPVSESQLYVRAAAKVLNIREPQFLHPEKGGHAVS